MTEFNRRRFLLTSAGVGAAGLLDRSRVLQFLGPAAFVGARKGSLTEAESWSS